MLKVSPSARSAAASSDTSPVSSTARSPRRWLPPPRHPAPEPAAERTRGTSLHPHPGAGSQPGPLRLSARALRSITAQPHISLAAGPIRPTTALLLDPPPGCGHRRLHPRLRFPGSAHAASPKKRNHPQRPLTQIEASSRPPSFTGTLGRHPPRDTLVTLDTKQT